MTFTIYSVEEAQVKLGNLGFKPIGKNKSLGEAGQFQLWYRAVTPLGQSRTLAIVSSGLGQAIIMRPIHESEIK